MDPWLRLGVHCVWGSDYSVPSGSLHHGAMEKIRNLRQITAVINGQEVTLVSTGAVAHVLGRTRWCVDNWVQIGLLPPPPFLTNPHDDRIKRKWYPAQYLDRLGQINLGARLQQHDFQMFHDLAMDAYDAEVMPLLGGVTPPMVITPLATQRGRLAVETGSGSSAASAAPRTTTA